MSWGRVPTAKRHVPHIAGNLIRNTYNHGVSVCVCVCSCSVCSASTKTDSRFLRTSDWELFGSRAISGRSCEPGRRYSGGAASWLADSVFVLLDERFKLFPFVEAESAPVKNGFSVWAPTWTFFSLCHGFVWVHSVSAYLACVYVSVCPVCSASVPLLVRPEVQMLSADPAHGPDGAWLNVQCKALKWHENVDYQCVHYLIKDWGTQTTLIV